MSFHTELAAVDDYVVFDTETTGFYFEYDNITEIGAAKVLNGKVVDRFETLLNPGKSIPREVANLTGITNEMVANAPSSEEGVARFLDFTEGLPLVGHNVAFDAHMLHVDELPNMLIDTMRVGRRIAVGLPNYKLETLYSYCQSLGYFTQIKGQTHRAGYDAEMTRVIYEALKPKLGEFSNQIHQRRNEHAGNSKRHLSDFTIKKAKVLAQVRELADSGVESFRQIEELSDMIALDRELSTDNAFFNLLGVMSRAMSDNVITIDEQLEILSECRRLADPVVRDAQFHVDVPGHRFVITGKFEHGSDAEIIASIGAAGGEASKKAPTNKDDYVVVGNLGSKNWAFGDYGTKVDKAIKMQADGKSIMVISENVLFASLN